MHDWPEMDLCKVLYGRVRKLMFVRFLHSMVAMVLYSVEDLQWTWFLSFFYYLILASVQKE